jgi:hypothetical protein
MDAWLPCIDIDGTFMKHYTYNGVCVMVVGIDGDLKNVLIAILLVLSESTDYFLWVLTNFKAAGIDLDNLSDRGKQMNVQRQLTRYGATWLHIKNCMYHLSKNVCGIFSPNDSTLHNYIFGLENCTSLVEYIQLPVEITKKYGKLVEDSTNIQNGMEGTIMVDLMDLHPRQYSVMGNLNLTNDEETI